MSTIGNGRALPMTGWLLPWLKKNLIYCPELVDHYKYHNPNARMMGCTHPTGLFNNSLNC